MQTQQMKGFDARFRIALAFLVMLGILGLCFELWLFLWQDRFTDKFSRLDLVLAPISLAAGLTVGVKTGRWRFQALKDLGPQLAGKTLFLEKKLLSRSEAGQKALNWENDSYAALFYMFLAVWAITKAYFMPVGGAAFFVLGLWLGGQTVPYSRLWLWQNSSRSHASSGAGGEQAIPLAEPFRQRDHEFLSDQGKIESKKRFDARLRIALILIALISCLMISWPLPNEWSLGTSRLFGLALVVADLAAGLAVGVVIGRWRFRALQDVSEELAGTTIFREPSALSRSDFGRKAMRTEKSRSLLQAFCALCGRGCRILFLYQPTY